jgi:hypothetical protein
MKSIEFEYALLVTTVVYFWKITFFIGMGKARVSQGWLAAKKMIEKKRVHRSQCAHRIAPLILDVQLWRAKR